MKKIHQIKAVIAGLVLSSSVVPVATADDIEIYTTLGGTNVVSNPNIMFVIDTSGSMSTETWVKPLYDDSIDYLATYSLDAATSCVSTGVYFNDTGEIPDCATNTDYFDVSDLVCNHALAGYNADGTLISPGQDGSLLMVGTYSDHLARFDNTANRWREVSTSASGTEVECLLDSGIHGGPGKPYMADASAAYTNSVPADPEVPHPVWASGAGHLQLFSGNYLNYNKWVPNPDTAAGELVSKSYLEQVKTAVDIMVRGNTQVDIGLMRFDRWSSSGTAGAAEGGPVIYPILNVGADRNDFFTRLANLDANGGTPLSEAYYEALLYFGGKAVDYGNSSSPSNQVGTTHVVGGVQYYDSPISSSCDKNYIVMLSDGTPVLDDLNATRKGVLGGFDVGSCSTDITASFWDDNRDANNSAGSTIDNCLDELSGWASTHDVAVDSTIAGHDGEQHIITHTIGFNLADADAIQLMQDTADAGGGASYQATDESALISIFNKIIASTLKVNTTFSSPAVSVNAFNRSTHLSDLYFTLFKPAEGNHWEGNLKKYKLDFAVDINDKDGDGDITEKFGFIADQTGVSAINEFTGFFSDIAMSFWSTSVDGKEVSAGGAVSAFPDPTGTEPRKVYTFTGSYSTTTGVSLPDSGNLMLGTNEVTPGNASLTDALLNTTAETTALFEIVAGTPYRETLANWAKGQDALSQFGVANTYTDVRPQMGDPLHAEPALVQYGKEADGTPILVAYVATNDGYLHAFDVKNGKELFAFIPQELLPNLKIAMEDTGGKKLYGLDGSVAAWIDDTDGNGSIGAGEHVYIYFGMRRGGNNIYALDVTDKNAPVLKWVIKGGAGDYTELGQTWSTVNVEKIKDGTTEKTVLMFGGGYDTAQDSAAIRTPDSVGRTVYIADALSGERLWTAGADATTPTTNMVYSIPARIKPLDISGDGFIDRLYAADTGGQVFRFDINNTNASALASSITGSRIVDIAGSTSVDNRRFYYPPDVALIDAPDGKYHGLIMSSGFRAHPLNEEIHDRIYMVKDRNTGLTTTYPATRTEADLHDVTDNIAGGDGATAGARDTELGNISGAEGWYIDLEDEDNPGTWIGEKGLAEPLILEGTAIVTTYTPNVLAPTNSCVPNLGLGKIFYLDVLDGTPALPSTSDVRSERHKKLVRSGVPPSPSVIVTDGGDPTVVTGTEVQNIDLGLGIRKTYWYEVEK